MVWCDEATVNENVPESRLTLKWNLMWVFRYGNTKAISIKINGSNRQLLIDSLFWTVVLPARTFYLPLGLIAAGILRSRRAMGSAVENLAEIARGTGFLYGVLGFKYGEYERVHGN